MSNIINEQKNTSSFPQEITSYKPIRIIGRGSFGSLYEGVVLKGPHKNEHVAVKQVSVDKFNIKKYNNFKVNHNYIYNYKFKQL
jgi:hypothetical protein